MKEFYFYIRQNWSHEDFKHGAYADIFEREWYDREHEICEGKAKKYWKDI